MIAQVMPHLERLPTTDRDLIMGLMTRRDLRKGQFVFRESEAVDFVALVTEGTFKVVSTSAKGHSVAHQFLVPGDAIVEFAALADRRAAVSVQAITPGSICLVPRQKLFDAVRMSPAIHAMIMALLAINFKQRIFREQQILDTLAEERYRTMMSTMPQVVDVAARTDLASYIGITPESLSRLASIIRKKTRDTSGAESRGDEKQLPPSL